MTEPNGQNTESNSDPKHQPEAPPSPLLTPCQQSYKCEAKEHENATEDVNKPGRKTGFAKFFKRTTCTDWLSLIPTTIIMAATVTYCNYSGKQWDSMNKQAEIAQRQYSSAVKNFRVDERAWVGIKIFHPEHEKLPKIYIQEGKPFELQLAVTNYGKTPARELVGKAQMFYLKERKDAKITILPDERNGLMLPPTEKSFMSPEIPPDFIADKETIEGIKQGSRVVLIAALVKYKDIFSDKWHCNTFCMTLAPDLQGFLACYGTGSNEIDEKIPECREDK